MFQMTDSQQTTCTFVATDRKGNPAPVETPEWMVDNPNLLALAPSPDGLSCVVSAVGPLGTARLTFRADADMGSGVSQISGTLDIEVVAGQATTVIINAAPPVEQP